MTRRGAFTPNRPNLILFGLSIIVCTDYLGMVLLFIYSGVPIFRPITSACHEEETTGISIDGMNFAVVNDKTKVDTRLAKLSWLVTGCSSTGHVTVTQKQFFA